MGVTTTTWSVDEFRNFFKNGTPTTAPVKEAPKKSKYGNVKVEHDGMTFDSKKEGNRYLELKQMVQRGEISELHSQVSFKFYHNEVYLGKYIADFTYNKDGKEVVEDVKSEMTRKLPVYRLKKRMMLAFKNIEVQEV